MKVNGECPNCNKKFKEKDKIDLTPEPKEGEETRKRLVEKYVQKKRDKKSKEVNKEEDNDIPATKASTGYEENKSNKRQKVDDAEEFLLKESEEMWKNKKKLNKSKLVDKSELEETVKNKMNKDGTFKSLFNDDHKEVKEQDFLCRSGYGA